MPNNWKTYKLGELYKSGSGLSKPRKEFGFGNPFVAFKDVFYNYFLPEKLENLVNTNEKEINSCSVLKGDILLTRTSETLNELGMSSVALKDYPKATFNGFSKRLRLIGDVKISIDPVFVGYYLRSHFFRNEINKYASMTTRASLNNDAIYSIEIQIPEFDEQIQIGKVLKIIDDKIENNLAINKTLEDMAMALYKHWFVDFDFPITKESHPELVSGSQPIGYKTADGEFIDSKLGPIPKGWAVKRLDEILNFKNQGVNTTTEKVKYSDAGIPVIRANNISKNQLDIGNIVFVDEETFSRVRPQCKPLKGDILFTNIGSQLGSACISYLDFDYIIAWNVLRINVNKDVYSSELLVSFFNDAKKRNEIKNLNSSSTMPFVSGKVLGGLNIIVPDKNNLELINIELKRFYRKIEENIKENQTLTKLRDTLLPKLISGEVRLKEFLPAGRQGKEQVETVL